MKHVNEPLGNVLAELYRKTDDSGRAEIRKIIANLRGSLNDHKITDLNGNRCKDENQGANRARETAQKQKKAL